ncbi:uncharacterized protein LOC143429272 [Xylocopa sonorina]|uniref:uncharacterized protein LOC143429272 n=1 Tax=Xylocopa sonorina TaxID=1818115 RepID=UPI00403AB2CE
MLLEVEDETRDFVTIYSKDFQPRKADRQKEYRPKLEYPLPLNILNGPFKKCLNTQRKNATLPLNEQTEDPQHILNKIRERHTHLRQFLPEVLPDEDVIERKENEINETVYQLDYSKGFNIVNQNDYSPRVKIYGRKKDVCLPEDWVISETIQRKSYRNPWKIVTEDLLRVKRAQKPPDNIVPNEKERVILRIRTGDSEYDITIDATGSRVIKGRLHGPPLPTDPQIYTKGPDSPLSECSKILADKKFLFYKYIISYSLAQFLTINLQSITSTPNTQNHSSLIHERETLSAPFNFYTLREKTILNDGNTRNIC